MGLLVKKIPGRVPIRVFQVMLGLFLLYQIPTVGPPPVQAATSPEKEKVSAAKAEVSIVTDQQMDFGQLADKDGSVILGLADSITSDPSLIFYGGSPYSGIYTLTGDPSTAVDISISSAPADGFTLSSFVSSEGAIPVIGALLSPGGELVITVGATLTLDSVTAVIGNNQTISFTITSVYN